MELMPHQLDASAKLASGKILYGEVGTGKSATVLHYYTKHQSPKHIYVITTAKKRDSLDWEREAAHFGISPTVFMINEEYTKTAGILTVDSWNNLEKYVDIKDAFFIFDEQRLVGNGSWVKSFLKIAKKNDWVLLTGTPGDTWLDYAPVFIANGFYKNITNFKLEHVLYEPYIKYPKIRMYLNEHKLELLRNEILVDMPYLKHTKRILNWWDVDYNVELFKKVLVQRWHVYEDRPIKDAAELWRVLRRVVNSDPSRLDTLMDLMKVHNRIIVYYNFDYELRILRNLYGQTNVFEWNGHRKHPLSTFEHLGQWVYLVQYVAGAEAWNCISTDVEVLYSLTYSYKNFEQAQGRIDRLNTPFTNLYYYIFVSNSMVDVAIKSKLLSKESFNEKKFLKNSDIDWEEIEEHQELCQI